MIPPPSGVGAKQKSAVRYIMPPAWEFKAGTLAKVIRVGPTGEPIGTKRQDSFEVIP